MATASDVFRSSLLAAFEHFNASPFKFLDSLGRRALYSAMSHWLKSDAVPVQGTFDDVLALLTENGLPEEMADALVEAYRCLCLEQSELDARSNRDRLPKQQSPERVEGFFESIHDNFIPEGRTLGEPETFQQFLFDTTVLPRFDKDYWFALRSGNAIHRTLAQSYARFGIGQDQVEAYVGLALSELAVAACHAGDRATLRSCIEELQRLADAGSAFMKVIADNAVGSFANDATAAFYASENVLKAIGSVALPMDFTVVPFTTVDALARAHINRGGRLSDILPVFSGQTLEHVWRQSIAEAHRALAIEVVALSSCALSESLIAEGRSKEAEPLLMHANFELVKSPIEFELAQQTIKTVIGMLK